MNSTRDWGPPRWIFLAAFCLGLGLCHGCYERSESVPEVYGTRRGWEGRQSLNGTSVLAGLFRRRGHDVVVDNRISPRIGRFGTIVWFVDPEKGCPSPEVADLLSNWLSGGSGRRIVFAGWGYNAGEAFWTEGVEAGIGTQRRMAERKRAESMARWDAVRWSAPQEDSPRTGDCRWFRTDFGPREILAGVETERGQVIPLSGGSVELSPERLLPVSDTGRVVTWFRSTSGVPLVFESQEAASAPGASVVVVSNGSFLLNYGLANPVHRVLVDAFLERLEPVQGPVLFVSAADLRFSDRLIENKTAWSWINQPPLPGIVPHFLVLVLLFLVSRLPILGRPVRLQWEQQPGFGRHLQAVGQLLRRSAKADQIREWRKAATRRSVTGPGSDGPGDSGNREAVGR